MAEELGISVAFVLELTGGDKAVTVPRKAELYNEEAPEPGGHTRCVAVSDICGAPDADGKVHPFPWVADQLKTVIVYSDAPASLKLGDSGLVGLTTEVKGPWTKPYKVLAADAIAPFTVEGLRKAGLI